jgi:hypothetical protein
MVLEWFPDTLWDARENGHLTDFGFSGIRKIMKDVLQGIQELHAEGVIHLGSQSSHLICDRHLTMEAQILKPTTFSSTEHLRSSLILDLHGLVTF